MTPRERAAGAGKGLSMEHIERPTQEEIDRAVYVMNDWSGGQFDNLDYEYYYTLEDLLRFQRQAIIAMEYGALALDFHGTTVAIDLRAILPFYIRRAEIAEKPKSEKTTKRTYANGIRRAPGYVYLLQSPTSAYKIGRTIDPANRLRTFGVQLPFEVSYLCTIKTDDMYSLERDLHVRFDAKRINGEWFALSPEDVQYIKGLAT